MAIRLLSGETIDGNATFAGDVILNNSLSFNTNGFADFGNIGTGAMRFKPSGNTLALTLTGANATFAADVTIGGAFLKNSGTLEIKASTTRIKGISTNENIAVFNENGAVELYHDNSKKLATTANGVNIVDSELGIGAGHGTSSAGNAVIFAPYGLGTNIAGGELQLYGGRSTGSAAGGSIKFYTSPTGSSGSGANAHSVALTLDSSQNATFAGTAAFASNISAPVVQANVINNQANSANIIYRSGTNTIVGNNANALVVQDGGNVGIGTTSPSNMLSIKGSSGSSKGLDIFHSNGNKVAELIHNGSGDEGMLRLFDSNSETVRIAGENNVASFIISGNVGIGTTSPVVPLHIAHGSSSVALYTFGGFNHQAKFESSDAEAAIIIQDSNSTNNGNRIGVITNDMTFITNDSERMRIHASGRVSIGSLTASANTLTLSGTATEMDITNTSASGRSYRIESDSAGLFVIKDRTANADRITMDSSGNVGIGTASPVAKFEVTDGSSSITLQEYSNGAAIFLDGVNGDFIGGDYFHILADGNSYLGLGGYGGGTTPLNIDSSGRVGIGTTSPAVGSQLTLRSSASTGMTILSASNTGECFINFSDNDDPNVGQIFYGHSPDRMAFRVGDDTRITILGSNGNVGIGTSSPLEKLNIVETTSTAGTFFPVAISGSRYQADYGVGIAFRPENNSSSYANKTAIVGSGGGYGYNMADLHFCFNNSSTISDEVSLSDSKVVMKRSGNVGIGTTSPQQKIHIIDTDGANIILNSNTGAENNGIFMTEGAAATPYINGAYLHYDSTNNAFKINTGTSSLSTKFTIVRDTGNIGIGNTNPTTKLTVQGVITAGDSTTNAVIRRQHQSFSTMKPGPTSGGNIDMIFVDHTHSLDITVMAYINTSNVATGRGYSVAAYGSATASLTQTRFAGNISALSISYVNTGGSENYVLRVTTTYSGATAPTISVTATGQSSSKLRAAT